MVRGACGHTASREEKRFFSHLMLPHTLKQKRGKEGTDERKAKEGHNGPQERDTFLPRTSSVLSFLGPH